MAPLAERTPRDSSPHHFAFIDALRGWAIIPIVGLHSWYRIASAPAEQEFLVVRLRLGVQLFFIMSAFTLFQSLESRSKRDPRPFVAFFIRRFFRIAPLYYLAALFYAGWYRQDPAAPYFSASTFQGVFHTLTFTNAWIPPEVFGRVPGGWTISIEMWFYLMLPLLFLWIKSLRGALLFFGAATAFEFLVRAGHVPQLLWPHLIVGGKSPVLWDYRYYWLPSQLPIFALGIVLYFLVKRPDTAVTPVVIVLCLCPWLTESHLIAEHICLSATLVGIAWALSHRPVYLAVNPFTCWIGRLSFSIYLLHFLVLDLLKPLTVLHTRWFVAWPLLWAVALLVAAAAAAVTEQLVEKPGIAIGQRLIARLGRLHPSLTPATAP